jgi:hypothetical protein
MLTKQQAMFNIRVQGFTTRPTNTLTDLAKMPDGGWSCVAGKQGELFNVRVDGASNAVISIPMV